MKVCAFFINIFFYTKNNSIFVKNFYYGKKCKK